MLLTLNTLLKIIPIGDVIAAPMAAVFSNAGVCRPCDNEWTLSQISQASKQNKGVCLIKWFHFRTKDITVKLTDLSHDIGRYYTNYARHSEILLPVGHSYRWFGRIIYHQRLQECTECFPIHPEDIRRQFRPQNQKVHSYPESNIDFIVTCVCYCRLFCWLNFLLVYFLYITNLIGHFKLVRYQLLDAQPIFSILIVSYVYQLSLHSSLLIRQPATLGFGIVRFINSSSYSPTKVHHKAQYHGNQITVYPNKLGHLGA